MSNVTLKKLSEILGINISTVSRALKNHPDISAKTKRKVLELANTLDYEPNLNAISLRTRDSRILGIMVPSLHSLFYNSFVCALEEDCRKNDYTLLTLQSGDSPDTEVDILRLMKQNRIGGLFACLSPATEDFNPFFKLKENDIPVIFFDKVPMDETCCKVTVSDSKAAALAANTLLKAGKKNILALFGDKHFSITQKRLHTFREVVAQTKDDGIKVEYIFSVSTEEAEKMTCDFLKTRPDGIFCMSDDILLGVMQALQKKGIRWPDDISIVSMSNGFIPRIYYPPITYVETSGYKLGKLAFSSMMAHKGGGEFSQELSIECPLVEGGSVN